MLTRQIIAFLNKQNENMFFLSLFELRKKNFLSLKYYFILEDFCVQCKIISQERLRKKKRFKKILLKFCPNPAWANLNLALPGVTLSQSLNPKPVATMVFWQYPKSCEVFNYGTVTVALCFIILLLLFALLLKKTLCIIISQLWNGLSLCYNKRRPSLSSFPTVSFLVKIKH